MHICCGNLICFNKRNQKVMEANNRIIIKTNNVSPFIKESIERKKMIKSYVKGEITAEQLHSKGIRFASPL